MFRFFSQHLIDFVDTRGKIFLSVFFLNIYNKYKIIFDMILLPAKFEKTHWIVIYITISVIFKQTFCISKFRDLNNKCYCFALFSLLIVKRVIYLFTYYVCTQWFNVIVRNIRSGTRKYCPTVEEIDAWNSLYSETLQHKYHNNGLFLQCFWKSDLNRDNKSFSSYCFFLHNYISLTIWSIYEFRKYLGYLWILIFHEYEIHACLANSF